MFLILIPKYKKKDKIESMIVFIRVWEGVGGVDGERKKIRMQLDKRKK